MTTGQTLFVFGHEMGHYVLHHVWLGIALSSRRACWCCCSGRYHALRRIGVRVDDYASLPALLLAMAVFGFVSDPIANSLVRMQEHNADIYGLEVIHGIVPNSAAGGRRGVPDHGRDRVGGSVAEPVHRVLAVLAPVRQRAGAFCFGVRPVGEGRGAEVREVTARRREAARRIVEHQDPIAAESLGRAGELVRSRARRTRRHRVTAAIARVVPPRLEPGAAPSLSIWTVNLRPWALVDKRVAVAAGGAMWSAPSSALATRDWSGTRERYGRDSTSARTYCIWLAPGRRIASFQ